jgi:hypothetical protein
MSECQKPEKNPLGRLRCRWDNNLKNNPQEVRWRPSTALTWLRTATGGDPGNLLASKKELCSI